MAKYRMKPAIVDAVEWDPRNNGIPKPAIGEPDKFGVIWEYGPDGKLANGRLAEERNTLHVSMGNWIIKRLGFKTKVMSPSEFYSKYEKVED